MAALPCGNRVTSCLFPAPGVLATALFESSVVLLAVVQLVSVTCPKLIYYLDKIDLK
jgi:hypothetical protein